MQENQDIINLFKKIYTVIKKYGFKRVEHVLSSITDPVKQETIDFILFKAADAYQISVDEIKNSKKRGAITESRKMCFILFKKHLDLGQNEISKYFDRDPRVVEHALDNFNTMNKSVKVDKLFLEKYEVLEKEINDFKEKMVEKYSGK